MKYFVTGATGFVGSHVTRQLVEAGHQVVAVVRSPDKANDLTALGVTLHQGDVADKESMRAPMQDVDGIFHIAGWYKLGVRDKSPGAQINIQGTRNVLELMRELGIPKGVYTSTLAINSDTHGKIVDESCEYRGPHISEYDRTKWAAHYEVAAPMMAEGLPLVIVMPGVIYGPGDTSSVRTTFIQYLQHKLPVIPSGTAYSWGHVDDIARAHVLGMEKGKAGEHYIIAGPSHTLVEAMDMAQRITGVPAPRHVSPGLLRTASSLVGVTEKVVPMPEQYSAEYLRVSAGVTYLGTSARAQREWDYHPRPLEEGLAETLRHEMHLLGMAVKA
ncbi:MAG TPA: NAD-dependent epimerase/dehydratase family protein [Ktedonobacterales bacterium]|nr:NAD-dependent epimerase/dehydratase family protein [Ktedonobacterales bacterium]